MCEYVMGMMGATTREIEGGGSTFYLIVVEIVDTHGRTELDWVCGNWEVVCKGLSGRVIGPPRFFIPTSPDFVLQVRHCYHDRGAWKWGDRVISKIVTC
jgi:hypothetical protein